MTMSRRTDHLIDAQVLDLLALQLASSIGIVNDAVLLQKQINETKEHLKAQEARAIFLEAPQQRILEQEKGAAFLANLLNLQNKHAASKKPEPIAIPVTAVFVQDSKKQVVVSTMTKYTKKKVQGKIKPVKPRKESDSDSDDASSVYNERAQFQNVQQRSSETVLFEQLNWLKRQKDASKKVVAPASIPAPLTTKTSTALVLPMIQSPIAAEAAVTMSPQSAANPTTPSPAHSVHTPDSTNESAVVVPSALGFKKTTTIDNLKAYFKKRGISEVQPSYSPQKESSDETATNFGYFSQTFDM